MTFALQRRWSLALLLLATSWAHAAPLHALKVDPAEVTVSGVSAGGYMAVQLHVAFSATFKKGAGVIAGGPYHCAEGLLLSATGRCMAHDSPIPVSTLVSTTSNRATAGRIDPVSNLADSKVYLFSGMRDSVVKTAVMDDLQSYYRSFVPAANIAYNKSVDSEHSFVTEDFGSSCSTKAPPYINDCDFDLAGAMLRHLHGPLSARNNGSLSGTFVEFDQTEFVSGHGMAATGWVYVPPSCAAGTVCRLHVALHGCKQNTAELGQQFIRNTGYNRWADSNNMIVLYPQTSQAAVNGCWDWWGYDSARYDEKTGPQMAAVKAMVDRIASGGPAPPSALPAPTGVTASGATTSSMALIWNAVTGAVGYHVYRNGSRVTTPPITATTHTDTGLSPGTTYTWTVTAVDSSGGESLPSAPAGGTTSGAAATCYTSSNFAHVAAGRAYLSWWAVAHAKGSDQRLGFLFTTATLKQTAPGRYVVGTCP